MFKWSHMRAEACQLKIASGAAPRGACVDLHLIQSYTPLPPCCPRPASPNPPCCCNLVRPVLLAPALPWQVAWDPESGHFVRPYSALTRPFEVRTELQLLDPADS